MKDLSALRFTPSPTMVGVFKYADTFAWRDCTSHYPDPDSNLTQSFYKGEVVIELTWKGNGKFEEIIEVLVRADAPFLSLRKDDLLFYQGVGTPEELMKVAEQYFAKTDYYPNFTKITKETVFWG